MVCMNNLNLYIPRNYLNSKIYENNESESCWIELINDRQPNNSKTDTTFNIELKSILHKIKKERKTTLTVTY